ncbi:HEAT repeat domain-containing protein [Pseudoalteromonas fuliginea]|uniref:HEAT repeat domain-containing protein n=1 Tax=Pseudoalteromonas fuliginea TaxID=1872678 RepID=UPI0031711CBA
MQLLMETPVNIDELVKNANCKQCWKTRLAALEELRKYDCQQSLDVILRLALHDKVFEEKKEAFKAAQVLGITKNGKPISLGKKDIGFKNKVIDKLFIRVKRELKMEEFVLTTFKAKFKSIHPEMYDVLSFDRSGKFDLWIEDKFRNLPKSK